MKLHFSSHFCHAASFTNKDTHWSGKIISFHQPRVSWNKGISLPQLPFGVRSCDVAIMWPDWFNLQLLEPFIDSLNCPPGLVQRPWLCKDELSRSPSSVVAICMQYDIYLYVYIRMYMYMWAIFCSYLWYRTYLYVFHYIIYFYINYNIQSEHAIWFARYEKCRVLPLSICHPDPWFRNGGILWKENFMEDPASLLLSQDELQTHDLQFSRSFLC